MIPDSLFLVFDIINLSQIRFFGNNIAFGLSRSRSRTTSLCRIIRLFFHIFLILLLVLLIFLVTIGGFLIGFLIGRRLSLLLLGGWRT